MAYYVIKAGAEFNGMKQRGNGIQVLESTAVGSRERLVLVSYNNQRFLLGVTGQSVSVIDKQASAQKIVLEQDHPDILSNKMPDKAYNNVLASLGLTQLQTKQ